MARIPTHELDELKCHVSLLSLAQSQGHKFKPHSPGSYACLCPFHVEKTPSCVITPAKGLYHCFGCGAKGSIIDWQMNTTGQSLREAVTFLKSRLAGADDPTSSLAVPSVAVSAAPARQRLVDLDADGQALLRQVTDFYHHNLLDSPETQAWLAHRGLNHPELVSHFRLGYAGTHGISGAEILPSTHSKEGQRLRERLVELGVLRVQTRQDHFRGCVVMPVEGWSESAIVAHRSRILQLYGRRTQADNQIKKGSSKHLYLPSPLCGVWNEAAMQGASDIILCESLIDAMTFWCAGMRNVTTAYGVNGFTADHLTALRYHGVKRVLIAYDRDAAGDHGAGRVAAELLSDGLEAWRVPFPAGMDANEYALKSGSPESALSLALQQAQWMGTGSGPGVVFTHESPANAPVTLAPSLTVAAPAASPGKPDVVTHEVSATGDLLLTCGPRVWRVRGWQKQRQPDTMKVNVQVRDSLTGAFHMDSPDMYHARQRQNYVGTAATELACEQSVIKRECGQLLLLLEQKQDELRQAVDNDSHPATTMNTEDEAAALALLKSPDLVARVTDDLAACGVVGESTNLLTGYLSAVSRKLDKPLAVLIQSSSAAGKSSLMDAVLGLMPDEERVQYSAMTGQSLYYLGETSLQHKILAIAEEEGVRQAAYALKLLQSDGALTIASTGKNEQSGDLITREYRVQGPVMLMLTTTAIDVDEELLNRCLVLTVNESREQTQAIHAIQRHGQTLEGLLAQSESQYLIRLHQNAQRLLRPLKVVNPYAHQLTFLSDKTRTRRDHMKYLTLIQAVALLHQYQREVKRTTHRGQVIEYIEVTKDDIALATRLAHEVLGRTLDEMPPQTRKLLVLLKAEVHARAVRQGIKPEELRFIRRDVRDWLQWGDTQLKIHLGRLLELEYLQLNRRGQTHEYRLLWDGEDNGNAHLCGLPDVDSLAVPPVETEGGAFRSESERSRSASGRGVVGSLSDTSKPSPEQAERVTATCPGGQEENAVNADRNKTTLRPAALTAGSNRVSRNTPPEVTHG